MAQSTVTQQDSSPTIIAEGTTVQRQIHEICDCDTEAETVASIRLDISEVSIQFLNQAELVHDTQQLVDQADDRVGTALEAHNQACGSDPIRVRHLRNVSSCQ